MMEELVQNGSKMCKIMHNSSGFRLSACRLNTRKKAMKPVVNTENHCLIFDVGVTGLEPATTRPPDAYANQLRHTPNLEGGIAHQKHLLPNCECKGSAKFSILQANP